jgi:hypothetical protein
MIVADLKALLDQYEPDVEVFVADGSTGETHEVASHYDDECRPNQRGLVLEIGPELPPL